MFLESSKNLQENTFSCEFCEISKKTFFTEHLRTSPSDINRYLASYGTQCYMRSQFKQYYSENSGQAMLHTIRISYQTLPNAVREINANQYYMFSWIQFKHYFMLSYQSLFHIICVIIHSTCGIVCKFRLHH